MSWTVAWCPEVDRDIHRLGYRISERACLAAVEFARTGRGMELIEPGNPWLGCLRTDDAWVYVQLDPVARVVYVMNILRNEAQVPDEDDDDEFEDE